MLFKFAVYAWAGMAVIALLVWGVDLLLQWAKARKG